MEGFATCDVEFMATKLLHGREKMTCVILNISDSLR